MMATRGTSFYVPAIAPGVPPGRLCYGATCALEDYVGRRGLLRTLLIPVGKPLTMPVVVPLLSSFRDRAAPSPMRVVTRAFLPRYTVPDLESWATGTSRCLSKTRSRSYADEFSGGTRIAGATPPRPWSPTAAWGTTVATSCAGRSSARSPPSRPAGGVPGVGAGPASCDYEARWGAFLPICPQIGSSGFAHKKIPHLSSQVGDRVSGRGGRI